MFGSLGRRIFGTRNDHILKGFRRAVADINALEPKIQVMTDMELAAQTPKFRQQLADGKSLDDILPEAFATAREAARR